MGNPAPHDEQPAPESSDRYGRYCKPALVDRLKALRLDVTYERAEGDYLWYQRDGRPCRVLDLVGGYGTNLLGHNHPDLVAVAWGKMEDRAPVFAQASVRGGAARLAEALCRRLGDFVVTFTNSGTESVEAAIKHAHLERGRPLFWAVKGGFHGKTLGSAQLTWSQRELFGGLGPRVRFLDPDEPNDWAAARAEAASVCAAVIEPIAGEGGVRPRSPEFLAWLTATCREYGIPIVADEIQSGMGRTGTFLTSEAAGLVPDYICLGKALGGRLAKIGAMLVRRKRFVPEFSLVHSSTFAEDDAGCDIGVEVLRLLDRDRLPERCAARGAFLRGRLEALRAQYPDVLLEVRGSGLMIGLELRNRHDSESYVIRAASQQGLLGYLCASYFLRHHDIRVMPTLSQPLTLRVQPSAYISEQELVRFADAVEALCRVLRSNDAGRLLDADGLLTPPPRMYAPKRPLHREPPRTPRRVAFLTHLLSDTQLGELDASLAASAPANLAAMLDRTARVWNPMVLDRTHAASPTGDVVHLSVIGLGMSSRQMMSAFRARDHAWVVRKLDAAVEMAVRDGCQVVGFGGYTSILSNNCRQIRSPGAVLTTGNSLTVGMGLESLRRAARNAGIDLTGARVGIVGATGNIASTYAQMIAPQVREVILVVRDPADSRVARLTAAIRATAPRTICTVAEGCAALSGCSLIVAASNSPQPLIHPQHLGRGPVVICDISVPSDVADTVAERSDVHVFRGGVVRLPLDPGFEIGGIALPPGHSLACMAETLLLGLDKTIGPGSVGPVAVNDVLRMMAAADRHGFRVADLTQQTTQTVNRFFDSLRGRERVTGSIEAIDAPTLTMAKI